MKILHTVESYLPAHHGMSEVVRQISERLACMGHEVTVATRKDPLRSEKVISGVHIEEFDISGSWTFGMKGEVGRYCEYMLASDFDIVTNFAAQQWATDAILPILDSIRGKKVFVPTGYSGLSDPVWKLYYDCMPGWLAKYDRVIYLSDNYRDVAFAREHNLSNGILIPNGASAEEFDVTPDVNIRQMLGISKDDLLIIHVSGYVGDKGHSDAIDIFSRSGLHNSALLFVNPTFTPGALKPPSWPRLLARIMLNAIQKKATPEFRILPFKQLQYSIKNYLNHRKLLFVALSRPEVVAAYQQADLFLFPSHIECSPIVLFEAMAAKTPFLCTDVGNVREIVNWSLSGEILPTIFDGSSSCIGKADINLSAAKLTALGQDIDRREEMAKCGYLAWKNRFTWEQISLNYLNLYKDLL
jgi:glycosyltransferase involved in cell wall biosynthesis